MRHDIRYRTGRGAVALALALLLLATAIPASPSWAFDDLDNLRYRNEVEASHGAALSISWNPDSRHIAVGTGNGLIDLYDQRNGMLNKALPAHDAAVLSVAWSPDGSTIASGSTDGEIKLWDAYSYEYLKNLTGHNGSVNDLSWSPDSTKLVSASSDHTLRVWSVPTGSEVRNFTLHTNEVMAVEWSPDGSTVASGGKDHLVRLWDPATGGSIRDLSGHTDLVTDLAWAPDGSGIASASEDSDVIVWDPATGSSVHRLQEQNGGVSACDWSPDGLHIASASFVVEEMRLYDAERGVVVYNLSTMSKHVEALAISPDGIYLAAAMTEGMVKFYKEGKPVLSIKEVKANPDQTNVGEMVTLTAKFGNTGDAYARSAFYSITAHGPVVLELKNGTVNLPNAQDTTISYFWYTNLSVPVGIYRIEVVLKWQDVFDLSMDDSLSLQGQAVPYPFSVEPELSPILTGDTLPINVTIGNSGNIPGEDVDVLVYVDGDLIATLEMDIGPGQLNSTYVDWVTTFDTWVGYHYIKVKVGAKEITARVWVDGYYDLVIKDVQVNRTEVQHYDHVDVTVQVENKGSLPYSKSIEVWAGNERLCSKNVDIGPGETEIVTLRCAIDRDIPIGSADLEVRAGDARGHSTITVQGTPKLEIHGLDIYPYDVSTGDKITITVDIYNGGTADAHDVVIYYYLDEKLVTTKTVPVIAAGQITTVKKEWTIPHDIDVSSGEQEIRVRVGEQSMDEYVNIMKTVGGDIPVLPVMAIIAIAMVSMMVAILVLGSRKQRPKGPGSEDGGEAAGKAEDDDEDVVVLD